MKNLFGMITGVLVGITGTLLLTLTLWGSEWYKVLAAIAAGVLLGLAVASPKETWEMFKRSIKMRGFNKQNFSYYFGTGMAFFVSFISTCSMLAILLSPLLLFKTLPDLLVAVIIIFSISFFASIFLSLPENVDPKNWSDKARIWGEFFRIDELMLSSINKVGVKKTTQRVFKSTMSCYLRNCEKTFVVISKIFLLIPSFCLLAVLPFFLISLPLLVVSLIVEIGKQNWSLLVASSIVIGGLVGTISGLYFVGIGAGIVSLLCFYATGKWLKVAPFFMFKSGGWIETTLAKLV